MGEPRTGAVDASTVVQGQKMHDEGKDTSQKDAVTSKVGDVAAEHLPKQSPNVSPKQSTDGSYEDIPQLEEDPPPDEHPSSEHTPPPPQDPDPSSTPPKHHKPVSTPTRFKPIIEENSPQEEEQQPQNVDQKPERTAENADKKKTGKKTGICSCENGLWHSVKTNPKTTTVIALAIIASISTLAIGIWHINRNRRQIKIK